MNAWTDDRIEQLKALHANNHSAARIAMALGGISRNAVIGKIHRLGLAEPTGKPKIARINGRPAGAVVTKPKLPKLSREQLDAADQDLPATDDPLSAKGCRWPVGDVGSKEFRFCQRPRVVAKGGRTSSWCEAHYVRGHQRAA